MSITIHHLEGRFSDQDRTFPASADKIVFGRSSACDVAYPAERLDIAPEHLELTRLNSGTLQVQVLGRRGVELDGKTITKKDGPVDVASGSVVHLGGKDGPSFRIDTLAITIKHLEGPLAGTEQTFDESVNEIAFGRKASQVTYPPECTIVGKHHFFLERMGFGRYRVNLTDGLFVEINGRPASNLMTVQSGSVFRLGSKGGAFGLLRDKGPSFKVLIDGPARDTQINDPTPSWQKRVRQLAAAVVVLGLMGGGLYYLLSQRVGEIYSTMFSEEVEKKLKGSVYLIVQKRRGTKDEPIGTAWALDRHTLATNAHVVNALRDRGGTFWLRAPQLKGKDIRIVGWQAHPGYEDFADNLLSIRAKYVHFQDLSVTSAYDVGILKTNGSLPPPHLKIAKTETLHDLNSTTPVAMAGFPLRDIQGKSISVMKPEPQFVEDKITSVTDVFMQSREGEDPQQSLLIHHGLSGTGGSSGSPIINTDGDVVAIFNAGNIARIVLIGSGNELKVSEGVCETTVVEYTSVPTGSDIFYAQRADVLQDLLDDNTADSMKRDKAYWASRVQELLAGDHADEVAAFEDALSGHDISGNPEALPHLKGELNFSTRRSKFDCPLDVPEVAQHVQDIIMEPGWLYGLFVDTTYDAVGLRLNDGSQPVGSTPSGADSKSWLTVDSRTTIKAAVWGFAKKPVRYELHVYRWKLPASPAPEGPAPAALSP